MIRMLSGDCRETLRALEPGTVQSVITSPPYYGLRDYGLPPLVWGDWYGSLGLEPTPDLFVAHLVDVFREVRRVLRDDGTLWLNLGDSYNNRAKIRPSSHQPALNGFSDADWRDVAARGGVRMSQASDGLKEKDLMMMPARVAMALQADGWYLRSMIPWLKRNSMPESVTDRPATAVEYVFLLSKSARYYWDADAVRLEHKARPQAFLTDGMSDEREREWREERGGRIAGIRNKQKYSGGPQGNPAGRNRRNSDWFFESWQGLLLDEQADPLALVVNPAPFKGSHFATFPAKLVEPMVKASTSERGQCPECGAPWVRVVERERPPQYEGGKAALLRATGAANHRSGYGPPGNGLGVIPPITTGWRASCAHADMTPVPQTCLDTFGGAGTVGLVADRLQRNAVLCELNPSYADMGADRIVGDAPLFSELVAD